ncbi:hypothetical protein P692DRAFT_2017110 [Suillus brevipes Sb2]|nr:hypothetical protein P692DRAFT_2017110 [Suillus brevipes Sb2]
MSAPIGKIMQGVMYIHHVIDIKPRLVRLMLQVRLKTSSLTDDPRGVGDPKVIWSRIRLFRRFLEGDE